MSSNQILIYFPPKHQKDHFAFVFAYDTNGLLCVIDFLPGEIYIKFLAGS